MLLGSSLSAAIWSVYSITRTPKVIQTGDVLNTRPSVFICNIKCFEEPCFRHVRPKESIPEVTDELAELLSTERSHVSALL